MFIDGAVGRRTWREEGRGRARDHTSPPSRVQEMSSGANANLTLTETLLLGYMHKRDDFEVEFDNEAETLVRRFLNF